MDSDINLRLQRVQQKLQYVFVRRHSLDEFGAEAHQFAMHAPITEHDLTAFESKHGVRLPEDYRAFLLAVGNGGAGPYYGLLPKILNQTLSKRLFMR